MKHEFIWINDFVPGSRVVKPKKFVIGTKIALNGKTYVYKESIYNVNFEALLHVYEKEIK